MFEFVSFIVSLLLKSLELNQELNEHVLKNSNSIFKVFNLV